MDVHPTKNVSIGIDPYPYDKISAEWSERCEMPWHCRHCLVLCMIFVKKRLFSWQVVIRIKSRNNDNNVSLLKATLWYSIGNQLCNTISIPFLYHTISIVSSYWKFPSYRTISSSSSQLSPTSLALGWAARRSDATEEIWRCSCAVDRR